LTLAILGALVACLGLAALPGAAFAQAGNGISQPEEGDTLAGVVVIEGTATDAAFLRYEVAFRRETPTAGDWIVFAQGDRPVVAGTLAVWDTTVGGTVSPVFPDGRYQLRLRVVRQDYNYDEFFVRELSVSNLSPTPTATITGTVTAEPQFGAPTPGGIAPAAETPVILPSLTPFPTPSPLPTPLSAVLGAQQEPPGEGGSGGLAGQIRAMDYAQFGRAFWQGATVVAYVFLAMGLYLVMRGVARWVRRRWLSRHVDRSS
jgi:hypothetical protein